MKTSRLSVCIVFALLLGTAFNASDSFAKPRPPLPPFPDGHSALIRFNEGDPLSREIKSYGEIVESWSGHALHRSKAGGDALVLPLQKVAPTLDLNESFAVRFWFSSTSDESPLAKGPKNKRQLIGLQDLPQKFSAWRIIIQSKGDVDTVEVHESNTGGATLSSLIVAGVSSWHQVVVVDAVDYSALYVDGVIAAVGEPLRKRDSNPAEWTLVIGNSSDGASPACAQIDEIALFPFALNPISVAQDYDATLPLTILGPVTETEEAEILAAATMSLALALQ